MGTRSSYVWADNLRMYAHKNILIYGHKIYLSIKLIYLSQDIFIYNTISIHLCSKDAQLILINHF